MNLSLNVYVTLQEWSKNNSKIRPQPNRRSQTDHINPIMPLATHNHCHPWGRPAIRDLSLNRTRKSSVISCGKTEHL